MAANQTLRLLDIQNNLIGDAGAAAFANNTTLMTLNLSNNVIGAPDAQALAQNQALKILSLNGNPIPSAGVKTFAQNTTLISLGLEGNTLSTGEIENEGAQALALSTTLRALNLSRNRISNEGAKALAQNQSLTALNIDDNPIFKEGTISLIENPSLKALNLSIIRDIRQDEEESTLFKTLLKVLVVNTNLTQLYLPLYNFHDSNREEWESALSKVATINRQIHIERKDWIEKLLILAADRNNSASASAFSKLPRELVLYIITLVALLSTGSLGKTEEQIARCSHFIFEQIVTIIAHLRQGDCFQIKERIFHSKPSNFRLRFFKPLEISKEEIDQEITALDIDYRT